MMMIDDMLIELIDKNTDMKGRIKIGDLKKLIIQEAVDEINRKMIEADYKEKGKGENEQ